MYEKYVYVFFLENIYRGGYLEFGASVFSIAHYGLDQPDRVVQRYGDAVDQIEKLIAVRPKYRMKSFENFFRLQLLKFAVELKVETQVF